MLAVSSVVGANLTMSVDCPNALIPRAAAACSGAGESVCWVRMSQPWSMSALAASPSFGGSYHELIRTNFSRAFGLTDCIPSMNAFSPCTTSGTGTEPTYPASPDLLSLPAITPWT